MYFIWELWRSSSHSKRWCCANRWQVFEIQMCGLSQTSWVRHSAVLQWWHLVTNTRLQRYEHDYSSFQIVYQRWYLNYYLWVIFCSFCAESFCVINPARFAGEKIQFSGSEYMKEGERKYYNCIWPNSGSLFECTNQQLSVTRCKYINWIFTF